MFCYQSNFVSKTILFGKQLYLSLPLYREKLSQPKIDMDSYREFPTK